MPPALETPRLLLRPFTPHDLDAAYAVLEENPDVWRFDPGYQRTREQRDKIILRYAEANDPAGVGTLAVTLKPAGTLIGYAGLQLYLLPSRPYATPEVELYYKLGREYWGAGLALEACQALVRYAFDTLHLRRIVTVAMRDNQRSIRLMQRLGMRVADAPPAWPGEVTGTLENTQAIKESDQ